MEGLDLEAETKNAAKTLNKDTVKLMEKCLQELTTTGSPSLDAALMKKFKGFCRQSDDYVRYAFLLIMRQLSKKHSEIRFSAFQVVDELFNRSHAFREKLITHLQAFVALTTGIEAERPLPPPKGTANRLKTETLHALQRWYDKYGKGYRKLAVGYDYLKNSKHVDFNDLRAQNEAERRRLENEEKRKQKIMADKLSKVLTDISELKPEIEDCVKEAGSCLKLLLPTPADFLLSLPEEASDGATRCGDTNTVDGCRLCKRSEKFSPGQQNLTAHTRKDVDDKGAACSCDFSTDKMATACSSIQVDKLQMCSSSCAGNKEDVSGSSTNRQLIHTHKSDVSDFHIVNSMNKNKITLQHKSLHANTQNSGRSEDSAGKEGLFDSEVSSKSEDVIGTENVVSEEEDEESDEEDLQAHGIPNPSYNLVIELPAPGPVSVQVTTDNKDVVRTLEDTSKLITNIYLPRVTKWVEVLTKNGGSQKDIKAAIDLKVSLKDIKMKCVELNLVSAAPQKTQEDASDDEEFEDVPEKEGYEPHIPVHLRAEYGLDSLSTPVKAVPKPPSVTNKDSSISPADTDKPNMHMKPSSLSKHWSLKDRISAEDVSDPTSLTSALAKVNSDSSQTDQKDVLSASTMPGTSREDQKAPVVEFGTDLVYWENPEQIEAPSIVKLDSLHRFWTPKEPEHEKPSQHDVASLKNRVFFFTGKFEPVKWKCRAVMPSGKLCERMDRIKCPFHGKIIPRDKSGKPNGPMDMSSSDPNSSKSDGISQENDGELPPWQDPELQREIELATGHDLGSARSQKLLDKKGKGKGKGKGKRKSGLTDIKALKNTTRKRLEDKIFDKRSLKRVCSTLDNSDYKRVRDKFANQFNYSVD